MGLRGWLAARLGASPPSPIRAASIHDPEPPPDGVPLIGVRGARGEALNAVRARERKRRAVTWRRPTAEDEARYERAPLVSAYADFFVGAAAVDGEIWLLFERLFNGFPDPPTYCVFFLDAQGSVLAVDDFDHLPRRWVLAPALSG